MASYTWIESIPYAKAMTGDGVGNLYVSVYVPTPDVPVEKIVIYSYNIETDVSTDISGNTFVGYGNDENLVWWSKTNTLYMVCEDATANEAYVFRWNGSQSWTAVDTVSVTPGVIASTPRIAASPDRLAWTYRKRPGAVTLSPLRGSSNGTSWNQDVATGCVLLYYDRSQYDDLLATIDNGGGIRLAYRNTSGSTWSALNAVDYGVWRLQGTDSNYSFIINYSNERTYYSTDFGDANTWETGQGDMYAWSYTGCVFEFGDETVIQGTTDFNRDEIWFWDDDTKSFAFDGQPANNTIVKGLEYYNGSLYALLDNTGIYVRDDPIGPVVTKAYSIGAPEAMDVSADDYYLYVGVLDGSSQPVLLRLLADLSVDPTKVYEPGAGSAIGVQCGDESEDWVWIAGDFGGGIKVRNSIDDGTTWTTKDPGTWNGVALPHIVGPWWDNLVLVPTDGDDTLRETEDGGLNWADLNAALPFDVGGMDRLDINLDEIVIGSDAGRDIQYSPNNAASFEDITDVSMADVPVTDVIIG
jgi:hypothetical protein